MVVQRYRRGRQQLTRGGRGMFGSKKRAAESWRRRLLVRVAGSVGGAFVVAGVLPALANAAGAHVVNPVAIALRASGDQLSHVFGGDTAGPNSCASPSASPSLPAPSVSPSSPVPSSPAPSSPAPS